MTCIVAVKHEGRVYMGADSATACGDLHLSWSERKLFTLPPLLIGYCGAPRAAQVLRHHFQPPTPTGDLVAYLSGPFTDGLRALLKSYGILNLRDGAEGLTNWTAFLIGCWGQLFELYEDFQIGTPTSYASIGSGRAVALGSLHATHSMPLEPRERLRLALAAAEAHTTTVRGPFFFEDQG